MILGMILRFLILSVAVYLIARILPGVRIKGFKTALVVSGVYSLLNFVLFRLLVFVTFPLLILKYLTLGVFGVILNAILLKITDRLVEDFEIRSFGWALLYALGISGVNLILTIAFGAWV
jgi:putative membrane protein